MTKLPEKCKRDTGALVLTGSVTTDQALWSLSLILGEIALAKEGLAEVGVEGHNGSYKKNSD